MAAYRGSSGATEPDDVAALPDLGMRGLISSGTYDAANQYGDAPGPLSLARNAASQTSVFGYDLRGGVASITFGSTPSTCDRAPQVFDLSL